MSRGAKIFRNVAVGLGLLVAVVVIAALVVVHTAWFREYVRTEIIATVEDSTGGRVEVGAFRFDESRVEATIDNLVIHGYEPPGAAPFVRVRRAVADLRLFTSLHRLVDITRLAVEQPEVRIVMLADGRSNVPSPKNPSTSQQPPLKTVVDLAIGHFDLNNGQLALENQKLPLSAHVNNLRAQLAFNILTQNYAGEIAFAPVYVVSGKATPVVVSVKIPLTIGNDRIELHHANIATAASQLSIDGSLENIRDPHLNVRVNGTIATADLKNVGNLAIKTTGPGVPAQIRVAADMTGSRNSYRVTSFQATLGASSIEASGGSDALAFRSTLDAAELGRLFDVAAKPAGILNANGTLKLGANDHYSVDGNLSAKGLSFRQGDTRISNVNILSAVTATQNDVELRNLVVSAFGGQFEGNASLHDARRYQVDGKLRRFEIQTALNMLGQKLPYDGSVTGNVAAAGDLDAPNSLIAHTQVTFTPGKRGIGVSGRMNAEYAAASGDLTVHDSWLGLPHSRIDLDGTARKGLRFSLKTQDPEDFLAAANVTGHPVTLNRGDATLIGVITGGLRSPHITGHLASHRLVVEGRQFDSLAADLTASESGASLSNGQLERAGSGTGLQAQFSASVGLANWKLPAREPVKADLSIGPGDLADLAALAGQNSADYSGPVTATAHVTGTVGNPLGAITVDAGKGNLDGQLFDQAHLQANLTDQLVTIPASFIQLGTGRVDMSGEFRHPADSFTTGQIHAKVMSNQVSLASASVRAGRKMEGTVQVNLDGSMNLSGDMTTVTGINGSFAGRKLTIDGQTYGDLDVSARTTGQTVAWNLNSTFAASTIRANGSTQLIKDYPTTADASIANLAVEQVLAAAKRTDIPARGVLGGTVHVTGTLSDPRGDANLEITRATVYDEPIDRIRLRASYLPDNINVQQLQISADGAVAELSGRYDHPVGNLQAGNATFHVETGRIDVSKVHYLQSQRPGLAGTLQLSANGSGAIHLDATHPDSILLHDLTANAAATGLRVQGENFGDLKLTANTSTGNKVDFALDSNLADASIHGRGSAELTAAYPVNAQLTFNNLLYSRISRLTGPASTEKGQVEGAADGQITVTGSLLHTDQLVANLQLSRVNITAKATAANRQPVAISNQGPVKATIDHGSVQIQNAHLAGSGVDVQIAGHASLQPSTLAFTVNAKGNLGILPDFDSDIYSSGDVSLVATIHGTMQDPLVNGQVTLHDATLSYAGLPNGISNANGVIALNGRSASIENVTAESGGGKLTLSGFAQYGDPMRFGIHLRATRVRVRVQSGVSVVGGADVQLTGTSRSSVISGSVVIGGITYNPQTDIASILSRAEPSVQSQAAPSPILENMRLDVHVRTTSGLAVQADIAQGISANADLRVQGTADRPGVLGRVTISEGKIVFLGSSFDVSSGTIAFYNPLRVDPILDVSLQTQTQGIDVILRVTGPLYNMKLSYTSNPPLQFQEIVGLLATGKTPTSDPTLLANQPQVPQSSLQQMGESAVLGQAVASPVAGRLQRVFGVSQLKIDPAFQGGTSIPTARLTLQQRISSNLTFTYTSALDDPNGEIVKVEWAFDPKWSAVATRDQNGIFSINFFYKRQFR